MFQSGPSKKFSVMKISLRLRYICTVLEWPNVRLFQYTNWPGKSLTQSLTQGRLQKMKKGASFPPNPLIYLVSPVGVEPTTY